MGSQQVISHQGIGQLLPAGKAVWNGSYDAHDGGVCL